MLSLIVEYKVYWTRLVQNTAIPVSIPESELELALTDEIDSWINSIYKDPLNKPAIQLSQPPN